MFVLEEEQPVEEDDPLEEDEDCELPMAGDEVFLVDLRWIEAPRVRDPCDLFDDLVKIRFWYSLKYFEIVE